MSLDGRFLYFLTEELNHSLNGGRIQKIYQLTKTDFLLLIRAGGQNYQLNISLSTSLARIHLTKFFVDRPDSPTGFCMLLRKYLEGGFIKNISLINSDRIIQILIENQNEIGETLEYHLIMEIMGRYANLIVTDANSIIIDSYKHISPFEEKERTILKGVHYPIPQDDKMDPLDIESIKDYFESHSDFTYKDLINNFRGFSPLLSKYFIQSLSTQEISPFELFLSFSKEPINPTLYLCEPTHKFYYFDVFNLGKKQYFSTLSELLDEYFHETSKIEQMKQVSKNIFQFVKKELEKNISKLEKLYLELESAKNSEAFRMKGALIIQNQHSFKKGDASFKTFNYETNEELIIELDRLLSPIQNANHYFKKYKKSKTAIHYIEKQIQLTIKQINYFDLLTSQIETASLNDLDEISLELISQGFIKAKGKKVKKGIPNYDTYIDIASTTILVGKNNLQNEYLTHKIAKNNEWWFHTKEAHGAHVIVRSSEDLTETTIRSAANLAAYYSKSRFSSSVPVDYTLVKYVKKIPGEMGCFVHYSNQKTIYIDPDKDLILTLKKVKH
ncbi:MAG: NFACT family protein [Firmicutes bacterium]|nr:NFACT family protein [Bacillota bacterium]